MGGIKTPIEIESNLSWNRLVRQSFQAIPVPESWNAQWKFQIPPVSYPANGFIYLVGVGSDSAPPTWRLGCSVRLASGAVPDSTGEFASAGGLPLRVDDRRPCTLGSYTLLMWPDMNLADPHLIVEFPHWLQDATIEIFWYDGETTGDFFSKLRESLVEIFEDTAYLNENLGQYVAAKTTEAIQGHEASENPHSRYLEKYEASQQYLRINDLDEAIADSDALRIALNSYILKSEANAAFVPVETFNQERTFVDAAIDEAKAIAAAELAAHLGATNPHNITPQAIGALEEGFRVHNHDEKYAAIDHSHEAIEPTANLQVNSLSLSQPLSIIGGGTGANNATNARTNLGLGTLATQNSNNVAINGGSITFLTNPLPIAAGGTSATTAAKARAQLGAVGADHPHNKVSSAMNFSNGWVDYSTAVDYKVFVEKVTSIVLLTGLVKNAASITSSNNKIGWLTSGYRPATLKIFICRCAWNNAENSCRVDINTVGDIIVVNPLTVIYQWISFAGIVFTTT